MPRAVLQKRNAKIGRTAQDAVVHDRLTALGANLVLMTPEQFGAVLKSDAERWARVLKSSGAKAD